MTKLPQGCLQPTAIAGSAIETLRAQLRQRLGLKSTDRIVLSVGYADARKGVDLLAEAFTSAFAQRPDVHVVWVGHREEAACEAAEKVLRRHGMLERFHFSGLDFDTDDYYAGADVYALASREDPFPSVVLEALSVELPVVAFAGTGAVRTSSPSTRWAWSCQHWTLSPMAAPWRVCSMRTRCEQRQAKPDDASSMPTSPSAATCWTCWIWPGIAFRVSRW